MSARKIALVAALNAFIVIAQILVGSYANSTALITDALHNFGDVLALIVTLIAFTLGTKPANHKMTFGYIKAEMMATFINALFLCVSMCFVFVHAIESLGDGEPVKPIPVMIAAIIGVIANGIGAYILRGHGHHHGHHHDEHHNCEHSHSHDLNIRSSFLHLVSDALVSVGVLASAICIYIWDLSYIDSIVSIVIALYILKEGIGLLKQSFFALLDANQDNIDVVNNLLCEFEQILSIHDVHLYRPSSKDMYLSAHIVLNENLSLEQIEALLENIREKLASAGITHTILQPESVKYAQDNILCAAHH